MPRYLCFNTEAHLLRTSVHSVSAALLLMDFRGISIQSLLSQIPKKSEIMHTLILTINVFVFFYWAIVDLLCCVSVKCTGK